MSQLSTAHPGQRDGGQGVEPFEPILLGTDLLIRNIYYYWKGEGSIACQNGKEGEEISEIRC